MSAGHQVVVEMDGGSIGADDQACKTMGAEIVRSAQDVYDRSELIVKVKEPQPNEYGLLREHQLLLTYLHLAPDPRQTEALIQSKCTAIAYETVTNAHGGLPLLAPMSEVAGRLSVQAAARSLEKTVGGCGVLLSGVPGVQPAEVVIVGAASWGKMRPDCLGDGRAGHDLGS